MSSQKPIVLVTGASGFIGQALAQRLREKYEVVGLDSKAPKVLGALTEFVPLDLTSQPSVADALAHIRERYGDNVASVIHLAAYYDFSGEPSPLYEQVTVRGTERLLAELHQFELEQFIFSSTMLVHAPTEPGTAITESSAIEPKWDYPASKVETEELIAKESREIPYVILRIAGVYDDDCHCVPIANQIQRIFERKLISHVFPGDPSHGQSFLHLEDLVAAIELSVERRRELGQRETLLLGEPAVLSYEELQTTLGRLIHNEEWETRRIPKPMAKAGAWLQEQGPGEEPFIKPWMIDRADEHFEIDISHTQARLGWLPQHSLRQALPRIVSRLKADPLRWYRKNKLSPPAWLEPTESSPLPVVQNEAASRRVS